MINIIIIGAFGEKGKIPCGGETCKNNIFKSYFSSLGGSIITKNTSGWKRNPFIILNIIFTVLTHPSHKIFLSVSRSANKVIRLFKWLHIKNDIVYCVVGGNFHKLMAAGIYDVNDYKTLKSILVQNIEMFIELERLGLKNVHYVPNVKMIEYIPNHVCRTEGPLQFVFMSQVRKEKGCDLIIDAVKMLNDMGFSNKFSVTFYGKIKKEYESLFLKKIVEFSNIKYKGVLNLNTKEGYDILSSYDAMLFPTYWVSEGFPGVFIDAFISSLPIIASDWNFNAELVEHGKNGLIVRPQDSSSLRDAMLQVIENRDLLIGFSRESGKRSGTYDIRNIYNDVWLCKIGLI